jgi:hypothetical protein
LVIAVFDDKTPGGSLEILEVHGRPIQAWQNETGSNY